jgi:uncharacterized repeat protein (TIGR01451 family)/fimbrial isopeptide formation D2 family protein
MKHLRFVRTRGEAARFGLVGSLSLLASSLAFAVCSGSQSNIVCTPNAGAMGSMASAAFARKLSEPQFAALHSSNIEKSELMGTRTSVGAPANGLIQDGFFDVSMLASRSAHALNPVNRVDSGEASIRRDDAAKQSLVQSTAEKASSGIKHEATPVSSSPGSAVRAAATINPAATSFCNTSTVTFPNVAGASGSPYPTQVNVNGMAGTLAKVTIGLNGLSHQFPDDLDLMVSAPNGRSLIAFSDVGGSNAVTGLNIVLDSSAAASLPDSASLSSGTFRPSDFLAGSDSFAAPAPTTNVFSASATSLGSVFNNSNPNGVWTLWTSNDGAGVQGGGSLANGWCVNLTMTPPQLTIAKTHVGNFFQGQSGAQYTVTVGSSGPGSTAGTITVVDTPPSGLTITGMSGSGWTCTAATGTCTTNATLAVNTTLPPITVTVNIAANASSPKVNSANVSGGGALGASADDSTIIVPAPDLTVSKVAQGSGFQQGGTVTYLITVANGGTGATANTITLQDTIPTGLTVTSVSGDVGWTCTNAATVSCTRTTAIAAGATSVITLTANILANAPASITNTALVQVAGESNTGNNSGSSIISVAVVAPDLTITKVAQGSGFQQGGTVSYLLTVTNGGNGATVNTITMQDTIPTGLSVTSVSGTNWTCTNAATVSCTRTTPIAAGTSSVITLNANIAANAPASITNTAVVQVASESNTGNNSGSSIISVTQLAPDLTITKVAQGGSFLRGGTVVYQITVTNGGNGATTNTITMQDTIPTGLTVTSVSGPNWTCTNASVVSCTRSTAIAAGASSVITLNANIATNAPASITNTATVQVAGESNSGNNSATSIISTSLSRTLAVNVVGGTWGNVVSSPPGINCPGTCTANFADGAVVTLTRQAEAAADGEFVGWTAPATCATAANADNATCVLTMSAAQSAAARFTVSCRLDADGDNAVRASTDILMITRRMLGVTGSPVISGAFNPGGSRTTEGLINAYIAPRISERRYDINLDGVIDWRDAAILARALSGFVGNDVTQGLITLGSQRQFWDQPTMGGATDGIKQYLNSRCALALP